MLLLIAHMPLSLGAGNLFQYIHVTINPSAGGFDIQEFGLFQYIHVTINLILFQF